MPTSKIFLSNEEWNLIRKLKLKLGFTWRGVIIDWHNKTK